MVVESLESRVLFASTSLLVTSAELQSNTAVRHDLHRDSVPKTLATDIVGVYHGEYQFARDTTQFGAASMVIKQQRARSFSGTMAFDFGGSSKFTASLSTYRAKGTLGAGYYATFRYVTFRYLHFSANLLLRGAIVPGHDILSPGFTELDFQMTGWAHGWIPKIDGASASLFPDSQRVG